MPFSGRNIEKTTESSPDGAFLQKVSTLIDQIPKDVGVLLFKMSLFLIATAILILTQYANTEEFYTYLYKMLSVRQYWTMLNEIFSIGPIHRENKNNVHVTGWSKLWPAG